MQDPASRSMSLNSTSRRDFLKRTSGITFCLALGQLGGFSRLVSGASDGEGHANFQVNAWVSITADGEITIMSPADEMGQGSFTSLPLILAEEMDADWDDVIIESSPTDEVVFGNPGFHKLMYTAISLSVVGYYDTLRHHGAQVRRVLMSNAAEKWQVPLAELSTEPSRVVHKTSGRGLSYGEIAEFARQPEQLPQINESDLKSPSDFRLIGRDIVRRDVPAKVKGEPQYSIDVSLPDMVYATAVRSPIMGGTVAAVDDTQASKSAGVLGIFKRENSVVLAADSTYHALSARGALRIEWNRVGAINDFDSDLAVEEFARQARDLEIQGPAWEEEGDINSGFETPGKYYEREYCTDYLYYAQIEPMNAAVWVKDDGSVEAWVGTQAPAVTVRAIAATLDIDGSRIKLHRCMLGGGFGRRTISEMDYVVDAAWLSQQMKKPVKVVWSREDDVVSSWHKPMTAQFLRANLDKRGNFLAWHHRIAVQEPLATAEPGLFEGLGRSPVVSMNGSDQPAYDFPNRKSEHIEVEPGIRTYPTLAVSYSPNEFASESFIDEIAGDRGVDPVAFRRRLLKNSPRALKVLNTVSEAAQWGKPLAQGRARGLAFCQYDEATVFIAAVAEVSLEPTEGRIQVHELWIVADCGLLIHPANARAQITGAAIFGLGGALTERTTFQNGVVQQSNFHDYRIATMSSVPRIHLEMISNINERPHAVGQVGAIPIAPAIGNAFAALTGSRLRHMPFTPERVKRALDA